MGCDSHLYLPPTTRMDDFAEVLGILLGAKAERRAIAGSDGVFVDVKDAPTFGHSHTPTMAVLSIGGFWHWECHSPIAGARLFSCRTAEPRRPVLEALADIFGGMLDFNDCDSIDVDYMGTLRDKPYRPDASNGQAWDDWQTFKLSLGAVADTW